MPAAAIGQRATGGGTEPMPLAGDQPVQRVAYRTRHQPQGAGQRRVPSADGDGNRDHCLRPYREPAVRAAPHERPRRLGTAAAAAQLRRQQALRDLALERGQRHPAVPVMVHHPLRGALAEQTMTVHEQDRLGRDDPRPAFALTVIPSVD